MTEPVHGGIDLEDKFRKISPRLEGKGTGDENDGREVIIMETD